MSLEIKQFEESIRATVPISDLSKRMQDSALDIIELLEFNEGDFVFKEGDKDNFSYYVLDGELELIANSVVQSVISSKNDHARYAIAKLKPRKFSARAKQYVVMLRFEKNALDKLMACETGIGAMGTTTLMGVAEIGEEESGDWMTRMLQSEWFARLPMENIQRLFTLFVEVSVKAGEVIMTQGEPGDCYYIIREGRCEVLRSAKPGAPQIKLAELSSGQCFGEQALLTDSKRNATVKMLTNGILMKLEKDDFLNLVKKPVLGSVSIDEGKKIVAEGGKWVDVRFAKEHERGHIAGSINIPVSIIRNQMGKLDQGVRYVAYCDTGGRSSVAAFLMSQQGLDIVYINGGVDSCPELLSESSDKGVGEPPSATAPQAKPATAPQAKPVAAPQAKPAAAPQAKPAAAPQAKPAAAPQAKPAAAPQAKPAAAPQAKPAATQEQLAKQKALLDKRRAELARKKAEKTKKAQQPEAKG